MINPFLQYQHVFQMNGEKFFLIQLLSLDGVDEVSLIHLEDPSKSFTIKEPNFEIFKFKGMKYFEIYESKTIIKDLNDESFSQFLDFGKLIGCFEFKKNYFIFVSDFAEILLWDEKQMKIIDRIQFKTSKCHYCVSLLQNRILITSSYPKEIQFRDVDSIIFYNIEISFPFVTKIQKNHFFDIQFKIE